MPWRSVGARPPANEEQESFDALYRACVADVHGYVLSLLGDRTGAEDVTAIAFERLWRARERLDARRGSARGLLFTIARNAALDELRSRKRRPPARGEHAELGDAYAGRPPAEDERGALVAQALEQLSVRERELVLLKFHGQLSNGELARALGISETNAGTRLHRALTRLRGLCAELEERQVA